MTSIKKSIKLADRELTLEYGRFAEQADSAVLAQYGETMVLVSVVSASPREDLNYMPLFVEYIERLYAGGKIKGSRWVKREGKPSDEAVLKARLIDRSIRPLFPEGYRNETQVVITLLSDDRENDPDVLSIIGASAALAASSIPWEGPVGAVRMGYVEETNLINPTRQEIDLSDLELIISGIMGKTLMLEGSGKEIPEEKFINSVLTAQKEIDKIIEFIKEFAREVNPIKQPAKTTDSAELVTLLEKEYLQDVRKLVKAYIEVSRDEERKMSDSLIEQVGERFKSEYTKQEIAEAINKLRKNLIRKDILEKKKRIDGRKPKDLREISSTVNVLPRTHGSAEFCRGSTQALTVTTLGSPGLEQWLESPAGEDTKRYMHHYYMPPYSVGETGRFGWPSRREVGHGALAERALTPVLPSENDFSYTVRVVSEILSSNGSTSMAAVCGSSLSLMDAGVPIKNMVAGISVGLVTEKNDANGNYVILKDIMGIEDFNGDMDFKIAGTEKGITAVQLDVKIRGINEEILKDTVKTAREARLEILKEMKKTIRQPRDHVSKYAPKVDRFEIPKKKIGAVIGPGGKIIRQIIAEYNVEIDVEDDGTVTVSGLERENVDKASDYIKGMTREFRPGDKFTGTVKRIVPFGAFVEIFPGREGLVHISKMAKKYVSDPNNIVSEGDDVEVKIREIDDENRINLTMLMDEKIYPHRGSSRRPPSRKSRRPYPSRKSNRPRTRNDY